MICRPTSSMCAVRSILYSDWGLIHPVTLPSMSVDVWQWAVLNHVLNIVALSYSRQEGEQVFSNSWNEELFFHSVLLYSVIVSFIMKLKKRKRAVKLSSLLIVSYASSLNRNRLYIHNCWQILPISYWPILEFSCCISYW